MQPLRGRLRCIIRCAFSKCSTRPACCICNIHQGLYHMMLHNTGDCPRTGLAKIVTWNSGQLFLQVMSFVEWRAALWTGLHGTHRSKPSQQGHIGTFQEDVFVFTWLRLQKAIDRLLRVALESGAELGSVTELQRLQGISNQVRSCPAAYALHAKRLPGVTAAIRSHMSRLIIAVSGFVAPFGILDDLAEVADKMLLLTISNFTSLRPERQHPCRVILAGHLG